MRAKAEGLPDPLRARRGGARTRRAARWPTCAGSGTGTSATTGACSRRPPAAGRNGRCARRRWPPRRSAEIPRILRSDRLQGPRQRLAAFRALADAALPGAADARRARRSRPRGSAAPAGTADVPRAERRPQLRGPQFRAQARASRSAGRAGPRAPRLPRRNGGAGSRASPAGAPASRRSPRRALSREAGAQAERQGSAQDCLQPLVSEEGGDERRLRPASGVGLRQLVAGSGTPRKSSSRARTRPMSRIMSSKITTRTRSGPKRSR